MPNECQPGERGAVMTDLVDEDRDTAAFDADPDALHLLLQMSGHLAALRTRDSDGELVSMRTWTVVHVDTGVEIGVFEHWAPDLRPFNLLALEGYCLWLEGCIDLVSDDPAVIAERLSVCGTDVFGVAAYYIDKINDWVPPVPCACGAPNAHPFVGKCWRCHVGVPPENTEQTKARSAHTENIPEGW